MRIAAYTVFYDTKRMSELGRGSPTPMQNPPECVLKATIAFLLLLHRLWTLQNGPLGVSSGLMGVPRATSGDFWTPLGALLGSLGHSWGPLWRPKNPQISEKFMKNSKNCCLLGFRASFSCPPDDLKSILDPPRWIFLGSPGGDLEVTSLQNLCEFLAKSMQDPCEIQENILSNPNA